MNNHTKKQNGAAGPVDPNGILANGVVTMGSPTNRKYGSSGRTDARARAKRGPPPTIVFFFGFSLAFVLGQLSASTKNSLLNATTATLSMTTPLPSETSEMILPTSLKEQQHKPAGVDILVDDGDDDAKELAFQSALNTMSCFMSPGCFPSYPCHKGKPMKLKRSKRWEEMPFCVDDLPKNETRIREHQQRQKSDDVMDGVVTPKNNKNRSISNRIGGEKDGKTDGCLVYSFGIHDSIEWETKIARLFGCEVHAFDPTVDITTRYWKKQDMHGVTFHKLGLQGVGTDMSTTHGIEYKAIDPNLLLPLQEIQKRLGHDKRSLDLLMLDCEGCEWGVLQQLACNDGHDTVNVKQLVVEMHFQKSLGMQSDEDVLTAGRALTCLRRDGWGIVSSAISGCNSLDGNYTRGVADIIPTPLYLMYVAMERKPSNEPTLSDIFLPNATIHGRDWYDDFKAVRRQYYMPKRYAYDTYEHFDAE